MPTDGLTQFKIAGGKWLGESAHADFVTKFAADPEAYFIMEAFLVSDRKMRAVAVPPLEGGVRAHIKQYKAVGVTGRLRNLFRTSQADAEFAHLLAAKKAGLPVPEVILFGRHGSNAYLATQFIRNSEPLAQILRRNPSALDDALIRSVAELVARVHKAGFLHHDLHLGNILRDGDGRLYLVDLHRLEIKPSLSDGEIIRNLAFLDFSFSRVTDLARRKAFHAAYNAASGRDIACDAVLAASKARGRKYFMSRTRRCLRDGEGFVVAAKGAARIARKAAFSADIAAVIKEHKGASAKVLKENAKTRITTLPNPGGAGKICVKEFRRGGAALESFLRGPRGLRAWVNANGLLIRGVGTPEPLAYLHTGKTDFVITVFEESAEPLDKYLHARFEAIADKQRLREKWDFMRRVGAMLARLHEAEVYHKDLKANNVLVAENAGGPRFLLLDLDRVRFDKPLSAKEAEFNLACLNAAVANFISVTDRLRAYMAYTGEALTPKHKGALRRIREISIARRHFWKIG